MIMIMIMIMMMTVDQESNCILLSHISLFNAIPYHSIPTGGDDDEGERLRKDLYNK